MDQTINNKYLKLGLPNGILIIHILCTLDSSCRVQVLMSPLDEFQCFPFFSFINSDSIRLRDKFK